MSDDWGEARERHWAMDCLHWRHRVLTGKFRHWCGEWDGLPVDETMPEWPCGCFPDEPHTQGDAP